VAFWVSRLGDFFVLIALWRAVLSQVHLGLFSSGPLAAIALSINVKAVRGRAFGLMLTKERFICDQQNGAKSFAGHILVSAVLRGQPFLTLQPMMGRSTQ